MYKIRAFTLIELLVTIAIVGILLTVGVPSLSTMNINSAADRYRDDLLRDISFARDFAVNNVTTIDTVSVTPINNDWSNGWQVISDGDDGLVVRIQTGSATTPLAATGTITSTYTSGTPLVFDDQGRVTSAAGSFTINVPNCTGNRVRTISITFMGQVLVQEAAC